ncbi:MAG: GIY-YIG nuclease family protein [Sphingobacteriales bacterium]|nr:MAG: GIY-YIG nuclease family protein [Sphingobacteriales bacterium]
MKPHNYYVYIITNINKKVLYTGVTNNLKRRLYEHENGIAEYSSSFTGRYNVQHLLYFEYHQYILDAIAREKQIKGWTREKKVKMITDFNPQWEFLNEEI